MEIITNQFLASTGYRCLFEYVKQEGITPVLELVKDIHNLSSKNVLIMEKLIKKNKDVIRYLKEHENELVKLSFGDKNVLNTLTNLSNDISLLNLYLENAKKLEALKIENIEFGNKKRERPYYCEYFPRNSKELKYIYKCYTDGVVYPRLSEEDANDFTWCFTGHNQIPFTITTECEPSFVLRTKNYEDLYQYREIYITDFSFDGSKLPTEEEIQSYKIPKELIKKLY